MPQAHQNQQPSGIRGDRRPPRSRRTATQILLALVLSGASCSPDETASPACAPGLQVSCPCGSGSSGIQVCADDGSRFGVCQGCDNADASLQDSPLDSPAPPDANDSAEAQTGCHYPGEHLDDPNRPRPTDGRCDGNTVYTCDRDTRTLKPTKCSAGEACVEYTVVEHTVTAAETSHSYRWAACIPSNAEVCSFAWLDSESRGVSMGRYESSFTAACDGNAALTCRMVPIPSEGEYGLVVVAGSTTGYVERSQCSAAEICAPNPAVPGASDCYASPLVACSPVANSACDGNTLLDCTGNPYQKRVDCGSQNRVCREDCSLLAGFPFAAAECRRPLPPEAEPCDPSAFVSHCSAPSTIMDCRLVTWSATDATPPDQAVTPDCFLENGQCVCYPTKHPCARIGCGLGATNCKCQERAGEQPVCVSVP